MERASSSVTDGRHSCSLCRPEHKDMLLAQNDRVPCINLRSENNAKFLSLPNYRCFTFFVWAFFIFFFRSEMFTSVVFAAALTLSAAGFSFGGRKLFSRSSQTNVVSNECRLWFVSNVVFGWQQMSSLLWFSKNNSCVWCEGSPPAHPIRSQRHYYPPILVCNLPVQK